MRYTKNCMLAMLTFGIALTGSASAEDRYVTLVLKGPDDFKDLTLEPAQVATLTYYSLRPATSTGLNIPRIEFITEEGTTAKLWWSNDAAYLSPLTTAPVLVGPCKIRVQWPYGGFQTDPFLVTFKIHTGSTPPEKTVVIPPGQGGAVALQCSSNLVDWVTATNGIYTNVPSMKFFRVNVERIP